MVMRKRSSEDKLRVFNHWVYEAHLAHGDWRRDSWSDQAFYDGEQWSEADRHVLTERGWNPLTINRVFPVVNLILGTQSITRNNITAKGRTQDDATMAQIMSEGIGFVMDQSAGQFLISQAFRDQIIPGIGFLDVCFNPDPRQEKLTIEHRDWKEVWWDPFCPTPWFTPKNCRYVFLQRWMDLEVLQALFPKHADDIEDQFSDYSSYANDNFMGDLLDHATEVEEMKSLTPSSWTNRSRKRVRPVQLWYPEFEMCLFAIFKNGEVREIRDDMDPYQQAELVQGAQELVKANVRKMQTATFFGNVLLHDGPTPYAHDQYPYVPFVGYYDRYGFPYGVPRQIKEQNMEVNKRRSMALAMMNSRQILIEEDASDDLEAVRDELNSPTGLAVFSAGALSKRKYHINEQTGLVEPQVLMLRESEREMREISGANSELSGYQSTSDSGKAIQLRQMQGSTMLATLMDNMRRSIHMTGEMLVANIQGYWSGEKILRITDNVTGAEKYVELNKRSIGTDGRMVVENNITQGRYDVVVAEAPQTDTAREHNINLLMETIKRAPPALAPQLFLMALEIMELPNKDQLLLKLRPMLGVEPGEEDLSPEELKEKMMLKAKAQAEQQQELAAAQKEKATLELEEKRLENEKLQAEILKIIADAGSIDARTDLETKRLKLHGIKQSADLVKQADEEAARQVVSAAPVANAGRPMVPQPQPGPDQGGRY